MNLAAAQQIADRVYDALAPHCFRISIAGSIRRQAPEVGDIEIVAIPKPYEVNLFSSGIAGVVNQWPRVKGELPCKYTRRRLPEGIDLDLFFATRDNWGYILAIRTGSADFSKRLAAGWVRYGFRGEEGNLVDHAGNINPVREERDLFLLAGIPWTKPENRE
jgi:DNA polymerase/3'-5' exonuclease PolX